MPHNPSPHPRITASPPIVHCSLSIVHSPSERHYNSALSIWLSVDPMADKYPSTSPYAYCANNPVKLVDPDGREWLDPEKDGKIAGELIYRAKQAICRHEKSIQKFQKWADKATDPKQKNDLEKGIADHKQRIDLLTEAIAGITEMGNKEGVYFHYNVNAKRTTHNVQLIRANDDNKHDYISINVKDSYIIQMHETVHAFDYMQGKYCLEFSNNGLLGSRYYHDESEIHAYQVEYSLSSTKERFPNIVHVQDINKKTIKSIEDAAPNSP